MILHRVGPDSAGEVDSVRAGPEGAFSFRLPSVPGGSGELYFASVEHDGILYFGGAIANAAQLDSLYVITVHDTTTAPPEGARLPVAVRYLVLERAAAPEGAPLDQGGGWRMTDLIQVENRGDHTLVAAGEGVVWSYPLPPSALQPVVGQSDVGPDAASVEDGRLVVRAPLPPGERQFILRYTLESPDVRVPMPGETDSAELLVREPAPPLDVEGLEALEPVAMDAGTTYRRYAAADLRDATVAVAEGEEEGSGGIPPRWLAVALALLLGAVGVAAVVRRGPGAPPPAPATGGAPVARDALLLEVARLDERLEAGETEPEGAEELRRRRAALVERLKGS